MKNICILFIFWAMTCSGQKVKFDYIPKNKDSIVNYINSITDKKIIKFGDQYKKIIKETLLDRKKNFIDRVNDSAFVFNAEINTYLNSIVKEIYKSNTNIKTNDFYFFIEKSPIPNAACYGNGVFTINMGLFNFVDSDDELAFIICHELAHYALEHTDKNFLKFLETINSKDTQKKVKVLKKQEFGRRKAYSELMDELNHNFLKRSQKVEIEADSLGLLLFSKTKFNINASTSSLANLEKSDNLLFNQESKLKEHFNFENYPFKDSWLEKDAALFDLSKSSNDFINDKDSLNTHPAIPLRIKKLNAMISNKDNANTVVSTKLEEIKKIVAFISVANFMDSNRLDLALYQCLLMYNQQLIDRKMYAGIVSKLLKKTYDLKNAHSFGKFVSPVYPFSDELHLNEIKIFLNNIELKNIKKIGLNFCLSHEEIMKDDVEFKSTLRFFTTLNN